MSEFEKKQRYLMKTLISDDWKRYISKYKPTQDSTNMFELYTKRMNSDEILLKCDLKLFLWTFVKNELYQLSDILRSPQYKDSIRRIFNAAMNNQIAIAERELSIFKLKKEGGDRELVKSDIYGHISYILEVCRVLYYIPDFTSIQDLTLMYMSEGLNRIHMGPVH